MSFEELFPTIENQSKFAVLRYDSRRKDKIQELHSQAYELYLGEKKKGKEIKKQNYKCFITQRAKELDKRSVVNGGGGGTSTIGALSFYRRRPTSDTEIVTFDD